MEHNIENMKTKNVLSEKEFYFKSSDWMMMGTFSQQSLPSVQRSSYLHTFIDMFSSLVVQVQSNEPKDGAFNFVSGKVIATKRHKKGERKKCCCKRCLSSTKRSQMMLENLGQTHFLCVVLHPENQCKHIFFDNSHINGDLNLKFHCDGFSLAGGSVLILGKTNRGLGRMDTELKLDHFMITDSGDLVPNGFITPSDILKDLGKAPKKLVTSKKKGKKTSEKILEGKLLDIMQTEFE
ncbi:hypothetical protein BgiMline_002140 [Biomphalaria glabrata]